MAPVLVTLNGLEDYSLVAGLFKCNPSNICAAFYQNSTDRLPVLCCTEVAVAHEAKSSYSHSGVCTFTMGATVDSPTSCNALHFMWVFP